MSNEKAKGKVTLGDELMFPSEFLCAEDLKGKDVTITIAGISKQDLKMKGGSSKRKPVLTFERTPKKLVLNVTNADSIATLYGSKADEWVGKRITVYPTTTTFGRQTVTCIRVRERVPAAPGKPAAAPTPPPEPDPVPSADGDEFGKEMAAVLGEEK